MEKMVKDFLLHLMKYTRRATGPFLRENTLKLGGKLMLISIILLLLVSKALILSGGEYFGIQVNIGKGNNVLIYLLFVVLIYFSIEYGFALNYDIEGWRQANSRDNQQSRELLKLVEDEKEKNIYQLQSFINENTDLKGLSLSLDNWIKINQYDKELVIVMEKNYKKISNIYNFRICSGFLPLIVFGAVLLIACYDLFVK